MQAIETTTTLTMDDAEAAVRGALAEQGFGVLTEIDVAGVLKAKLDVDRPPLKILGACNPTFAHQALTLDASVALLLPCNVVLQPAPGGGTKVSIIDPRQMLDDPAFAALGADAAAHLEAAVAALPT